MITYNGVLVARYEYKLTNVAIAPLSQVSTTLGNPDTILQITYTPNMHITFAQLR